MASPKSTAKMDTFNDNIDIKTSRETKSAYDSTTFKKSLSIRVEQPVSSMSISPSGRDVVLASREGLHIVDLDNPYSPPRFLQHITAWEVADVQWSPFAARDYWVISTSNQKALMWNLNCASRNAVETVLHGHSRAITDINFSAHDPDHLATCSVDSFVHLWDMKTPQKPVLSFADWFAGATQVKFNRQDEHILASAHDKNLHIWDKRKGAIPLCTIEAHDTKIYGIDWNRIRPTSIVTCSLDKAVKFWDYSESVTEPERVIRTSFPVWRARYTPFGWGTLIMPQRGGDDELYLYDRRTLGEEPADPLTKFAGHTAPIKEFLWRARGSSDDIDDREFQLVTWSKDNDLRLWEISTELMKGIGHDPEGKLKFRLTRRGAPYRSFRREPHEVKGIKPINIEAPLRAGIGKHIQQYSLNHHHHDVVSNMSTGPFQHRRHQLHRDMNPIQWMLGVKMKTRGEGVLGVGQFTDFDGIIDGELNTTYGWTGPETLADEITLVGERFKKVKFEKVSVSSRACMLSFDGPWGSDQTDPWVFIRCSVQFPESYPAKDAAPKFQIDKTMMIPEDNMTTMHEKLKAIADSYVKHNRYCLEACIGFLLGELADDAMYQESRRDTIGADSSSEDDLANDGTAGEEADELKSLVERNNQGNVPLPRACGAMWSETGILVCFFPPKNDPSRILTLKDSGSGFTDAQLHRSTRKTFETFGRLGQSYTVDQRLLSEKVVDGASKSEISDDETGSLTSSESGSTSSDENLLRPSVLNWRFSGRAAHRQTRRRNHSIDRSTRSITSAVKTSGLLGQSTVKDFQTRRSVNAISLIDLSHMLPAKECLAREYAIFGHGPDVCLHNAKIAEKYGLNDLVDAWKLAKMILCSEVPLDILAQEQKKEPILAVAKKASQTLKRRDSGIFVEGSDDEEHKNYTEVYGRVKWGSHPLGGRWLVKRLMEHFEHQADPQMLAMLACVFYEPQNKAPQKGGFMLHLSPRNLTPGASSPLYSLDYFPPFISELGKSNAFASISQRPSTITTPFTQPGSLNSSIGGQIANFFQTGSETATPFYSLSGTPPVPSFLRSHTAESGLHSLSSSPEQTHHHHPPSHHPPHRRSIGISNLASGFARAINSSQGAFNLISGSPPTQRRPRQNSPSESVGAASSSVPNNFASTITWAPNTTFNIKPSAESAVSEGSHDEYEDGNGRDNQSQIDIQIINFEQYEEEGSLAMPLLDSSKAQLYNHYRSIYSDLLYIWDFQFARLEMLKFNGLSNFNMSEETPSFAKMKSEVWHGLDLGGICAKCGGSLDSGRGEKHKGAKGYCRNCKRAQQNLQCSVCKCRIKGLYAPCLKCGHVSHADCFSSWFNDESDECPTGCGCFCMSVEDMAYLRLQSVDGSSEVEDDDEVVLVGHPPTAIGSPERPFDHDAHEEGVKHYTGLHLALRKGVEGITGRGMGLSKFRKGPSV